MKLVIVEDEYMVAKRLKRFIEVVLSGYEFKLQVFCNLHDAQEHLAEHQIDGLFLDLNLQGLDGFSLLKQQLSESFHTIVVSANFDRAIEAFDLGVLDFVAKPFTQERIDKAIKRLLQNRGDGQSKFLSYKSMGKIELLPLNQVLYVQAAGHYSEVFTLEGKQILHDKSLDKLLAILPCEFVRIHRSYAVPLTHIQAIKVEEGSKYWAILNDNVSLPIGRTRYKQLKDMLIT